VNSKQSAKPQDEVVIPYQFHPLTEELVRGIDFGRDPFKSLVTKLKERIKSEKLAKKAASANPELVELTTKEERAQ